ncbi:MULTISPECIES: sigma-70 family RNA polymerase sigma factor [Vibrio]|nr:MULTISPECIES: sigma-70 family RNA polymerase sigma factor [Vibrio]
MNASEPYSIHSTSDPLSHFAGAEYEQLREQMLRFAILQIKDTQLAEDAVQEAMFAAFQHREKFSRKAALKTWVFAILKNKLIDILRKERRFTAAEDLAEGKGLHGDELLEKLFSDNGHWQKAERPVQWQEPEQYMENDHFWRIFDTCLRMMPENYSRLFMMREFLELDSDEICSNEAISGNHLNVTLYRARIRLRECLEIRWFSKES